MLFWTESIETACSIWTGWNRGVGGIGTRVFVGLELIHFCAFDFFPLPLFFFLFCFFFTISERGGTGSSMALMTPGLLSLPFASSAHVFEASSGFGSQFVQRVSRGCGLSAVRLCVPGGHLHLDIAWHLLPGFFLIPRHLFNSFFSSTLFIIGIGTAFHYRMNLSSLYFSITVGGA